MTVGLRYGILLSVCICGLGESWGQNTVELSEASDPFGVFVTEDRYVEVGSEQSTRTAPEQSSGQLFAVWELNEVEQRDELGVALNPVPFVIAEATRAVAQYLSASQDTLGDGIADAVKVRYYGVTDVAASTDTDADGFDFAEELARGYHPKVPDEPLLGGIASRRTGLMSVTTDLNLAWVVQRSEPMGFVSAANWIQIDEIITLESVPESQSGYRFVGWYRGEQRLDDPSALPVVQVKVDAAALDLVARYVPIDADADADGVLDYLEWYYYGALDVLNEDADTDGDGFGINDEVARAYHPLIADEPIRGGIASRRTSRLEYNSGYFPYAFVSLPDGLLSQTGLAEDGSELLTPDLYRDQRSGYSFAYWSVGGTAQRLPSGEALSQLAFTVEGQVDAVAHYFESSTDSIGDGVTDWQKLAYYPSLAEAPASSDTDGDGFDLAAELAQGYHPHYADKPIRGGVSTRRTARTVMLLNVLVWGANAQGQLDIPQELLGRPLASVESGPYHNLALTQDGHVYGWGDNTHGQLTIPTFAAPVLKVVTGRAHSLALLEDGTVVAWGDNAFGQCTLPDGLTQVADIAAGADHCLAFTHEGAIYAWGRNESGQVDVPVVSRQPVGLAAGAAHSVVLFDDGTVVAWGDNALGQCDIPSEAIDVRSIASGDNHTIALRTDGRVVAWGDNRQLQTAVPSALTAASPVPAAADAQRFTMSTEAARVVGIAAGSDHNVVLLADGTVRGWGRNDAGQANAPTSLHDAGAVSAGANHSVVLRRSALVPTASEEADAPLRTVSLESANGRIAREPFQVNYVDGQSVSFTATAAEGFVFTGWSGALSGDTNPATLSISGDVQLAAHFSRVSNNPDSYDAWRIMHFGDIGSAPAQVLKQGRMVSLLEAYLLGADPLDPYDVAMAQMQRSTDGSLKLTLHGLAGRRYQLQQSSSMDATAWQAVGSAIRGGDALIEWPLNEPVQPTFYRIQILADE